METLLKMRMWRIGMKMGSWRSERQLKRRKSKERTKRRRSRVMSKMRRWMGSLEEFWLRKLSMRMSLMTLQECKESFTGLTKLELRNQSNFKAKLRLRRKSLKRVRTMNSMFLMSHRLLSLQLTSGSSWKRLKKRPKLKLKASLRNNPFHQSKPRFQTKMVKTLRWIKYFRGKRGTKSSLNLRWTWSTKVSSRFKRLRSMRLPKTARFQM